ncbi:MAG: SAM-dependent methyltransferase [Alphaproteobacteria bacterium]
MKGIFYGVGVGPGDPELMTVKAIQTIRSCEVIAIAVSSSDLQSPEYEEAGEEELYPHYLEKCIAYQIALPMVPKMREKPKLYLPMPMR